MAPKHLTILASSGLTSLGFSVYSPEWNDGPCDGDWWPAAVRTPRASPCGPVSLPTAQLVPRKCLPSEIHDLTRDQASKEVSRITLAPNWQHNRTQKVRKTLKVSKAWGTEFTFPLEDLFILWLEKWSEMYSTHQAYTFIFLTDLKTTIKQHQ